MWGLLMKKPPHQYHIRLHEIYNVIIIIIKILCGSHKTLGTGCKKRAKKKTIPKATMIDTKDD